MSNKVEIIVEAKDQASPATARVSKGFAEMLAKVHEMTAAIQSMVPKVSMLSPAMQEMVETNQRMAAALTESTKKMSEMVAASQKAGQRLSESARGAKESGDAASLASAGFAKLAAAVAGAVASLGLMASATSFISAGVEFNKTIETTRAGVASLVLASREFVDSSGRAASAQDALSKSFQLAEGVQQRMLRAATQTSATYTDLVSAFQTAYGPATAAGITSITKLEQVTLGASQAVAALGLDSRQLTQEIRALFTGEQGPDNTLNRVLGITKEKLDQVRASGGDVADFLLQKMKPFMDAASASTGNFAVLLSNAQDAFEQMAGSVSKPIFDELKAQIVAAVGSFDQFKPVLAGMGQQIAEILRAAGPVIESLFKIGLAAGSVFVDLVHTLTPLSPLLAALGNVLAFLVETFGAAGVAVFAFVKALAALAIATESAAAVSLLSASVTSLGTALKAVSAAQALSTFAGLALSVRSLSDASALLGAALPKLALVFTPVTLAATAAAAAFYAFGKAYVYLAEERPADQAWKNAAEGLVNLQNKILATKGVYLELAQVEQYMKLGSEEKRKVLDLLASGFESMQPPAKRMEDAIAKVTAEMSRSKAEAMELAAAYEKVKGPMGSLLDQISKDLRLGNLQGSAREQMEALIAYADRLKQLDELTKPFKTKDGSWREDQANLDKLRQIQAEFYKGSTEARMVYEQTIAQIREKAGTEAIAEQERVNEQLLESARKLWAEQEVLAEAWPARYAEVLKLTGQESDAAAAAEIARLQKLMKAIAETAFAAPNVLSPEKAREVSETVAAEIKRLTFFGKGELEIEMIPIKPIVTATEKVRRLFREMWDDFKAGNISARDYMAKTGEMLVRTGTTARDGILGQMQVIASRIPTTAETAAAGVAGVWDSMARAFDETFYSVLTGRLDSLGDVFKRFGESILKTFSQVFTDVVQRWIASIAKMKAESEDPNLEGPPSSLQGGVSGFLAEAGPYAAAGMGGYGIGSMIGGGDTANQIGGAVGGIAAQLGGIAGPVGMILGAIVGAIIGELFSPNTEAHLTGYVQHEMRKQGSAIAKTFEGVYSGLVDVFVAGAPDQAAELTKSYQEALAKAMASTRFDIAAGSREDIQKTWEWMVNSLLPKMGLQAAFGQVGMGLPHGNRDKEGGRGGFDWWSKGMDKDGKWIEQQLYNPEAPIPRMLFGLKFTKDKIEALARELANTDDPAAFLKKLEGLVSVVVGFNKLMDALKGGKEAAFTELDKTTQQRLDEQRGQLATGFQNLGLYTGDEQIQKAQELLAASDQWYQANLQYIGQLRSLMDGLLASIDRQIKGIQDSLKSWGQIRTDAIAQAEEALGKIPIASPEEIQKLTQQAQEAIGVIVSGMLQLRSALFQVKDTIQGQIDTMATWDRGFNETMDAARARAASSINALGLGDPAEVAKNGQAAVAAVNEIFEGLKQVIAAARSAMEAIDNQVQVMRTWDQSFTQSMEAARTDFATATEKLKGSNLTPEQITQFTNDAISAARKIFEGLKATIAAARSAMDAIDKQVETMRTWNRGFTESLSASRSDFVTAAGKLSETNLSPEEISSFTNDALDAARAIFEGLKAVISAARNELDAIDALAGQIRKYGQTTPEAMAAARTALAAGQQFFAGVSKDKDPAEIAKQGQATREAIQTLLDGFKAIADTARQVKDSISDLLGRMRDWNKGSENLLVEARRTATVTAGLLRAELGKETPDPARISELGSKAVEAVSQIFDALTEKISALKSAIASIDSLVSGLNTRIAAALGETPDQQLRRLQRQFIAGAGTGITADRAPGLVQAATDALSILIDRLGVLKTLFTDLGDLVGKFGSAGTGVRQAMTDAADPFGAYWRDALKLQGDVASAAKLSGQAQIDAITKVKESALELYERQRQLLQTIAANAEDMRRSIASQIWEINYGEIDPQGQANAVMDRVNALRQQLGSAASPEAARQITEEIQSLISRYLGLFGAEDPNRAGAVDWAKQFLEGTQKAADEAYARMWKSVEDSNEKIRKGLEDAGLLVEGSLTATQGEIEAWKQMLVSARGQLEGTMQTIGEEIEAWSQFLRDLSYPLNSAIDSAEAAISGLVPILEALKTPLQNAVTAASEEIGTLTSSLAGLKTPLETAVTNASAEIQKLADALAGLKTPLEKAVSEASVEIERWKMALQLAIPKIDAKLSEVEAEIQRWQNALTWLRGQVETNLNGAIDAAAKSFQLLVPEIEKAKGLFTDISTTVLPDVETSGNGASDALDRVTGSAKKLADVFDIIVGMANGGDAGRAAVVYGGQDAEATAAMFRDDPTLLMPATGY